MWPIWTTPLSGMAIRTLLSHITDISDETKAGEWKTRGVAAIYSSEVYKPNKYLTSFQAAELVG